MKTRNLQALFAYARKRASAAADANAGNTSSNSDDVPQIVRDIADEYKFAEYSSKDNTETIVVIPYAYPEVRIDIIWCEEERRLIDMSLYYHNHKIDIVRDWATDFEGFRTAMKPYTDLDNRLQKKYVHDKDIEIEFPISTDITR